jgi:hypothetical protein
MRAHCSCGDNRVHVVARRTTADHVGLKLWSDGAVTNVIGGYPPSMRKVPAALIFDFAAEVEAYDWSELHVLGRKVRG